MMTGVQQWLSLQRCRARCANAACTGVSTGQGGSSPLELSTPGLHGAPHRNCVMGLEEGGLQVGVAALPAAPLLSDTRACTLTAL